MSIFHASRKKVSLILYFLRTAIKPKVQVYAAPSDVHAEWDVPVTLRDGTVLRVNVFRPQTDVPVPVIMSAHPYGKDKIPAKSRSGRSLPLQWRVLPQPHPIRISSFTGWEAPDPVVWVHHGYAVINADLRGADTSEGVSDLFSDQEAEDYYDLIEWAGTQPWSSGRVGLDGVSYLALSQYKVAALHPPHLAAICPWEGLSDLYRDFARPGGIREDGFTILWSKMTTASARVRTPLRPEIVRRAERDQWFTSVTPDIEKIEVPILVCASFSDHLLHSRGSFEVFRRAGSKEKWLYTHRDGKWCAYYGENATRTRQRFFDYTLKKLDNGWTNEPRVRLEVTESGSEPASVLAEQAWPPKDLHWQKLWLNARTGTMQEVEPADHSAKSFKTRREHLTFRWTAPEDLDIIGPMAMELTIEVAGTKDVSLFASVRKYRAGVEQTFEGSYGFAGDCVSVGWQRAAHRELDEHLSTPEQPVHRHERDEWLRSGERVTVQMALRAHATRFRKGDELRLEIRGKWPYSRNPLTSPFPAGYQRSPKGQCTLHTGNAALTYLLIGARPPV